MDTSKKNTIQLVDFVKLISTGFKQIFGDLNYWIVAEISKIKQRHDRLYIELLQYQDDIVVAKAHAVILDIKIIRDFMDKTWLTSLEELNKIQILFYAKPIFHNDYGFQLHILHISSEHFIWAIKQKEKNIHSILAKLGIIENNKKLILPPPPYRIGIISSPTSDGLKDFLWVLDNSNYRYWYKLFPSAIHGNQANKEVHNALQTVFRQLSSGEERLDMLIILRWGGGSSGIMRHNDLNIAKGICFMPIPVFMAVWHKQDKYLLDEISYHSAISPSDAWHWIVWKYSDMKNDLSALMWYIDELVSKKVIDTRSYMLQILLNINNIVLNKLEFYRSTIQSNYEIIISNDPSRLKKLWYWLLYDEQGDVLNKEKIIWLIEWDIVDVKIYDQTIKVEVKSNTID